MWVSTPHLSLLGVPMDGEPFECPEPPRGTAVTALQAILVEAGLDRTDAWLLRCAIARLNLVGASEDDLAGLLLRWRCREQTKRHTWMHDDYNESFEAMMALDVASDLPEDED